MPSTMVNSRGLADLDAELRERAPREAGDVNLRDPDLTGDLGLGKLVEEREPEQAPLALVQHMETPCERDAVFAELVARLDERLPLELATLSVDELRRPCPEMSLDLAVDGRDRERGEVDAAVELKAVDGLDQADRAHLNEVLELLSPPCVLPGQPADEREVLADQAVACVSIAVAVVAAQELSGGRSAPEDKR